MNLKQQIPHILDDDPDGICLWSFLRKFIFDRRDVHKIYIDLIIYYYLMVVTKNKFMCGDGVIALHFCKVCGTPHISNEEAEECEKRHTQTYIL
jgi:hypothetical protein